MKNRQGFEHALNKFLKVWKSKPFVEGIVLTGSRVTSYASKRSDIDVYIILSSNIKWRERGNKNVNGFVIEYFANNAEQMRAYFRQEFEKNQFITARMLVIGKVLLDKTGIVSQLKKEAKAWMNKTFKPMSKTSIELAKYSLWDCLDNLMDCYDNSCEVFNFLYYTALNKVFEVYARFLRMELIPREKILKFLEDKRFRNQYKFKPFPDKTFCKLFKNCLKARRDDEKMVLIKRLTRHVLRKMSGFNINDFVLKTKVSGLIT